MPIQEIILLLFSLICLAFDIIDPDILIYRLQYWFGISSNSLNLLSSFLSDRFETVIASNSKFQRVVKVYGVPQGSVLGPLLYTSYTTQLLFVTFKYPIVYNSHLYADDAQKFLSFSPELTSVVLYLNRASDLFFLHWFLKKLSANLNKMDCLLFNPKYFIKQIVILT